MLLPANISLIRTATPATTPATTAPATTPATTVPPTSGLDPDDPLYKSGIGEVDLNERVFTIANAAGTTLTGVVEGSLQQQKLAEMYSVLGERFNCSFEFLPDAATSLFSNAYPVLMSGETYADALYSTYWSLGYFVYNGYAMNMDDISTIQSEQDYWTKVGDEVGRLWEKQYVLTPNVSFAWEYAWGVFFNKAMAEDLGLPDLYQLVRDGKWTIEKFGEYVNMATKDNGDNVWTGEDSYGWGGPHNDVDLAMFIGAGGEMLRKDENGKWLLNTGTAETMNLVSELREVLKNGIYDLSGGESWGYYYDMFQEDRMLFAPYPAVGSKWYFSEMDDFGFLPLPKLNDQQTGYYSYMDHNTYGFLIPSNVEKLEEVGLVLDAIACYSQAVIEPMLLEQYELTDFRDEESMEMLNIIRETLTVMPVITLLSMVDMSIMNATSFAVAAALVQGIDFAAEYEAHAELTQLTIDTMLGQ